MGLDMFFYGKWYPYSMQDERNLQIKKSIQSIFPVMQGKAILSIEVELCYWRKANAIHHWFVQNLQDDIDECQETYVNPDDLRGLKTLCEIILKDKTQAETLLPTQPGFFFGSTGYGDDYMSDVKDTHEFLSDFLTKYDNKEFDGWSFYYRSSW
jgi:hypothetical protein